MGLATSSGRTNDDLIDKLVKNQYIRFRQVEFAMRLVDRGRFFPGDKQEEAYKDSAWKSQEGDGPGFVHLSAPCIYANALEFLDLRPGLSFLNIGSGTGYFNTVAGFLLTESGVNHGVEVYENLVDYAERNAFESLQTPEAAAFSLCEPQFFIGSAFFIRPTLLYDRIYCGAQVPFERRGFFCNLLKIGGILVLPYGGRLLRIQRTNDSNFDVYPVSSVTFSQLISPFSESPRTVVSCSLPAYEPATLQDICRRIIRSQLRRNAKERYPPIIPYETLRIAGPPQSRRRPVDEDIGFVIVNNGPEDDGSDDDENARRADVGVQADLNEHPREDAAQEDDEEEFVNIPLRGQQFIRIRNPIDVDDGLDAETAENRRQDPIEADANEENPVNGGALNQDDAEDREQRMFERYHLFNEMNRATNNAVAENLDNVDPPMQRPPRVALENEDQFLEHHRAAVAAARNLRARTRAARRALALRRGSPPPDIPNAENRRRIVERRVFEHIGRNRRRGVPPPEPGQLIALLDPVIVHREEEDEHTEHFDGGVPPNLGLAAHDTVQNLRFNQLDSEPTIAQLDVAALYPGAVSVVVAEAPTASTATNTENSNERTSTSSRSRRQRRSRRRNVPDIEPMPRPPNAVARGQLNREMQNAMDRLVDLRQRIRDLAGLAEGVIQNLPRQLQQRRLGTRSTAATAPPSATAASATVEFPTIVRHNSTPITSASDVKPKTEKAETELQNGADMPTSTARLRRFDDTPAGNFRVKRSAPPSLDLATAAKRSAPDLRMDSSPKSSELKTPKTESPSSEASSPASVKSEEGARSRPARLVGSSPTSPTDSDADEDNQEEKDALEREGRANLHHERLRDFHADFVRRVRQLPLAEHLIRFVLYEG